MKKTIVIALFLTVSITGCIKYHHGVDIATLIDVRYENKQGNNLLNSNSKISVYYDVGGKKLKAEDVIPETRANNKGYRLFTKDSSMFVTIFVNDIDIKYDATSTTYVQFDDYPIDTIKCEHKKGDNYHHIGKIWLSGNLMPESYINFKSLTMKK